MSVIRKIINSPLVPKLPGAYNQAVQAGNVLYVSGSLGLDEKTLKPVEGGAAAEARQSLKNIHAILKHAGTSFDKRTYYVQKAANFETTFYLQPRRNHKTEEYNEAMKIL